MRWLAATVVLAAVGDVPAPAGAQPVAAPAEAGRVFDFAIPAKPLLAALVDFTATTGIQVLRPGGEAIGGTAPAVSGRLTASQALQALLAGSGLGFRVTNAETVTLVPRPVGLEGALLLPEVRVDAGAQRGWSPVRGYVAAVSAAGTKTDTPILETPQAISVVTRDQMNARAVQTMTEALRYTSGVFTEPFGRDPRYDQFVIRGFAGNGIGYYRDGLRELGNSAYFGLFRNEPYGLERVDVLKGPSSVLFGQNAPGGLVNMISKRPTPERLREVELQFGSNDRYQGSIDVGGPLNADGSVLYRITGVARSAQSDARYVSRYVPDDRLYLAPSVTWRPNPDTTITLMADVQRDRTGNSFTVTRTNPQLSFLQPTRIFLGDARYNRFDQDQFRIGYQLEHRFDDIWTVRQNFRYGHADLDYRYLTGFLTNPAATSFTRTANRIRDQINAATLDNQVQADFTTGALRHRVLAGFDYQHFTVDELWRRSASGMALSIVSPNFYQAILPLTVGVVDTYQTQDQYGLYFQDQVRYGRWVLTLGGRQDWAVGTTDNHLTRQSTRQSDAAFTGRAGLTYLFDSGFAPYVSYSESFLPTSGTDFAGSAFRPTTGSQYEAGVKFRPGGWNFTPGSQYEAGVKFQPPGLNSFVTVSAFNLTQQNALTPDPTHANFRVQTGEIRSRGIEVEGTASLAAGLNLIASYAYADVEVTQSNDVDRGKVPVLVPRQLAALWGDYTYSFDENNRLGFGAGVRFIGSTFANATNTIRNSSYTVADMALRYEWRGWRASLNVNNLFDRTHATCSTTNGCSWDSGRTVIGRLTARW